MSDFKPGKRVTLADIGRKAGYHFSTVGYALRDHPSIPEKTKAKIRKVAEEMGYRPDPALASLIAYRKNKQKAEYRTTIAIISDSDEGPDGWRRQNRKHLTCLAYWKGMQSRSEELGYRLQEFTLGLDRKNQERIDKILMARNIAAAILVPVENTADSVHLSWDRLSAITIGYSLKAPNLPRIAHLHRRGAQTTVEKLYDKGYRRLAFVAPYSFDERVDHAWSSGFLGACNILGIADQCSHYMPRDKPGAWNMDFAEWLQAEKPQVILSSVNHMWDLLTGLGYRIPEDIGLANLNLTGPVSDLSGIEQNSFRIGQESINLVSSLYINNIRGLPENEYIYQVKGVWKEGSSTPRMTPTHL